MKSRLLLLLAAGLFAAVIGNSAVAQDVTQRVGVCDPTPYSAHFCAKPDSSGNIPVTGTLSASIGGFPTVQSTGTPISVTTGGVTGTLPTGTVVVATNVGTTNIAYCKLGASATTSDQAITPNGGWFAFTVGANTQLTCITSTSTTTVNMVGGSGLPTGTGGGGGGSGGSSANIGTTGSAVPGSANYAGMNVAGNLTGLTGTANGLKVDPSAVTSPVSLASVPSHAVTNAGTFAVQLSGATNNINNVAGTVSLPTGASTAALQPTNAAQGSTTSGQTGHLVEGAVTTAAPTYTTAQTSPLSLDTTGSLRVNVTAGGGTGGTSVAQGSTTSGQNVSPMGCRTLTSAPTDTTAQTNMPSCDTSGALRVNVTTAAGVAQGSTSSGQTISPIGCRTLTSAPTDTTAQTNMPSCDTSGALRVNVTAGGGTGGTSVAQGSTTSGQNVSPMGARTLSATPTDTTAQTNMPVADLSGALVIRPYALPDVLVSGTTSAMTGTTSTSLIASPGGSLHNYITNITCVNSHATVGTFVTIQDGSGGTALYTLAAAAVFGGSAVTFPAPLRQPTAATALFVADVTTGANVICSASGFKGL